MKCEQCLKEFKWKEDGSFTPVCNECKGILDICHEIEDNFDNLDNIVGEDIIDFLADNMITPQQYEELSDEQKRKFDGEEE